MAHSTAFCDEGISTTDCCLGIAASSLRIRAASVLGSDDEGTDGGIVLDAASSEYEGGSSVFGTAFGGVNYFPGLFDPRVHDFLSLCVPVASS